VSIIASPAAIIHRSPWGAPVKANEPELVTVPDPELDEVPAGESVTAADDAELDVGALVDELLEEAPSTGFVVAVVAEAGLEDPTVNGAENTLGWVKSFWS
jgi:hypothetical protein